MKYTKIVCTIGPASENPETLRKMAVSGMDVARLNFSHGSYSNHKMLMKNVRAVSKEIGKPIGILQDLQGPKIRVGKLKKPVKISKDQKIILGAGGLPIQYDLSRILAPGQRVLIDDGLMELEVESIKGKAVHCRVVFGGTIISFKGINVPESKTDFSVFTEKDKKDLKFGLQNDVDFVAMSFVRTASDIYEVKDFIKKHSKLDHPWVIAKIEKSQAIKNLDEIIEAADGLMVARGDLGIEASEEQVPVYQKIMIKKCLKANKPVIVATQMLDSMMRNPRPTRAEVSDVANAVLDHTDAVMLSGESAFGKYPKETVATMARIVRAAEKSYFDLVPLNHNFAKDRVLYDAVALAKKHKAPVLAFSPLGTTAKAISNLRQEIASFVCTDSEKTYKQLSLVWGVFGELIAPQKNKDKIMDAMVKKLSERHLIKEATKMVFVIAKKVGNKEKLVSAQLKKVA